MNSLCFLSICLYRPSISVSIVHSTHCSDRTGEYNFCWLAITGLSIFSSSSENVAYDKFVLTSPAAHVFLAFLEWLARWKVNSHSAAVFLGSYPNNFSNQLESSLSSSSLDFSSILLDCKSWYHTSELLCRLGQ